MSAPRPVPLEHIDAFATEAQTGFWTSGANGGDAGPIRWTGSSADGEAMLQLANDGSGTGLSVLDGSSLSGGVLIAGGLDVLSGGANIAGNVGVTGDLNVNGNTDLDQALNVDGTFHAEGAADFDDAVDIAGSLTVHGAINAPGGLTLANLHLSGTLEVDGSMLGHAGFTLAGGNLQVTGGNASISAGTLTVVPNPGNDQALFVKHNAVAGQFSLGGTNSATPDLIFKDAAAAEVFRVGDSNATWQAITSGDHQITGRLNVAGDVVLGGASQKFGAFGSAGNVKGTVTGSRTVGGVALAVVLNILEAYGLLVDNSTA